MGLEDGPSEPVVCRSGIVAPAREETTKVDGAAEKKDVVFVALSRRGFV